uniref:Uncharacterized protein n=1 Tax=Ciona savignyi TaxID=51511 RepID=H2YPZ2_CIOSA
MRAVEKNLMVVTSWAYSSSKRSSDTSAKVNGIFGSQVRHSTESSWSSLPPSPAITSSVPTIPDVTVTFCDETKAAQESDSEDKTESKGESSVSPSDEVQLSSDVKDREISGEANEPNKEGADGPCKTAAENADSSAILPLDKAENTSNEKDPLPGVDTLVEKHSIVKSDEAPVPSGLRTLDSDSTTDAPDNIQALPSPKRKLVQDNEPNMDVASPTKRPKQDSESDQSETPISETPI